jgi:hypothetical protein
MRYTLRSTEFEHLSNEIERVRGVYMNSDVSDQKSLNEAVHTLLVTVERMLEVLAEQEAA